MYYDLCANSGNKVCVRCCYYTSQPCPLLQLLADQRNQAREFMPEHNTLTLTYVMKHMHIHIHTTHIESAQERYDTHLITRSCSVYSPLPLCTRLQPAAVYCTYTLIVIPCLAQDCARSLHLSQSVGVAQDGRSRSPFRRTAAKTSACYLFTPRLKVLLEGNLC